MKSQIRHEEGKYYATLYQRMNKGRTWYIADVKYYDESKAIFTTPNAVEFDAWVKKNLTDY